MSTRTAKQPSGGGLSATTLVIASLSSIAAAYVIHTFWKGGAILGAGLTPVIVAIVSESLKRPTQRITAIREERRTRSGVSRRTPGEAPVAPPPELERPDPFGIWEDDRKRGSRFHWVRGRPLKIAVATGLVGFLIAAFFITGADLIFGGGDDRLTIVPGKQERKATDDKPTTTEPTETTETVPPETTPTVPTTPPPTTPPPTTPPPTETVPAPTPQPSPDQPAPAPAPAPQQ